MKARGPLTRWKHEARRLRQSVRAISLAARDPRTPWYAKAIALAVAAYAVSPIDLIPDPIPVLGYLDDLVLLPIGIWVTLKLIPPAVWEESLAKAAAESPGEQRMSWGAAAVIVALWIAAAYIVLVWLWPVARREWLG